LFHHTKAAFETNADFVFEMYFGVACTSAAKNGGVGAPAAGESSLELLTIL
jgi:hypothetical protein